MRLEADPRGARGAAAAEARTTTRRPRMRAQDRAAVPPHARPGRRRSRCSRSCTAENPSDAAVMAELAQVDLDERQPEEAMRKIDVWISEQPDNAALYEMRAKVRLGSSDQKPDSFAKAEADLKTRDPEGTPKRVESFMTLGKLYRELWRREGGDKAPERRDRHLRPGAPDPARQRRRSRSSSRSSASRRAARTQAREYYETRAPARPGISPRPEQPGLAARQHRQPVAGRPRPRAASSRRTRRTPCPTTRAWPTRWAGSCTRRAFPPRRSALQGGDRPLPRGPPAAGHRALPPGEGVRAQRRARPRRLRAEARLDETRAVRGARPRPSSS